MIQIPPPFEVSAALVQEIRTFISDCIRMSRHTALIVPTADFPAWLVALGKDDFHAHMSKSGHRFVRAGYAFIGDDPVTAPMLSVTCDTPPAPWVSFPETEGDRRYMFRYTTNPLSSNETESQ